MTGKERNILEEIAAHNGRMTTAIATLAGEVRTNNLLQVQLNKRMENTIKDHGTRIARTEKRVWSFAGAVAAIGLFAGLVFDYFSSGGQ